MVVLTTMLVIATITSSIQSVSSYSIFLVDFSGNVGRNIFLTSSASQKIFRPYYQKSRLEYYFLRLFYFSSPYSGYFWSNFVVLLFLLTPRSRRTRKADQKCPEKQDKKSKRDMKKLFQIICLKIQKNLTNAFILRIGFDTIIHRNNM